MFENGLILPIAAFILTALADLVWVRLVQAVERRQAHAAARLSVAIVVCGSAFTLAIARGDWVAYLAALAGAYAGTWWAVKRGG